ncbi:MAG: ribosome recycling factor [Chlamydiae bacterium]|nr:ribosome recycling factor [Chlamydiota bacterium]
MNVLEETKKRMKEAVEHLKKDYKNLRSGRVNPAVLDGITVELYGSQMSLKSIATVSVQERQLIVTPFDNSSLHAIAKSIEHSPVRLQATVDGKIVRVPIPPMTEEVRKDVAKQAKKKCEDSKVVIRQVRRESNEMIKKQKEDGIIAEDAMKRLEKQIQELTDENCKVLDEIYKEKEKEVMTV